MQDYFRPIPMSGVFVYLSIVIMIHASGLASVQGETVLYSGGEWDFENGFHYEPHMLAGECSNPPPGGHQSCVPEDFRAAHVGIGWHHYASFPPPDWTGPPEDWYTPVHYGVAQFNENQNMANVSRGVRSAEITLTCANGVGIIYRQVSVPVAHRLRFEADAKTTESEPQGPNVQPWMGLDPTGNTDPEAGTVQWLPWSDSTPNAFHRMTMAINATGSTVTLFIMMLHPQPPCAGGTFMVDDVQVIDEGAAGPALHCSPSDLMAEASRGTNANQQTIEVSNAGSGTMTYTISDDADWLSIAPASGNVTTETDTITIAYDTDSLDTGTYHSTITVDAGAIPASPATVTVTLTILNKRGDFDGDEDVDQADFGMFQQCYSGEGILPAKSDCGVADLDNDRDVDFSDFAVFQGCISGAGVPSNPNCG